MGEPATYRRIYKYRQETIHTVSVIKVNFKTRLVSSQENDLMGNDHTACR